MEFTYALRFEFTATNNEEYEALIAGGLRIASTWVFTYQEANVGLPLVSHHGLANMWLKKDNMDQYLRQDPSRIIQGFNSFSIRQVPRWVIQKSELSFSEFIAGPRLVHEQKGMQRLAYAAPPQRFTSLRWRVHAVCTQDHIFLLVERALRSEGVLTTNSHAEDTGQARDQCGKVLRGYEALGKGAYSCVTWMGGVCPSLEISQSQEMLSLVIAHWDVTRTGKDRYLQFAIHSGLKGHLTLKLDYFCSYQTVRYEAALNNFIAFHTDSNKLLICLLIYTQVLWCAALSSAFFHAVLTLPRLTTSQGTLPTSPMDCLDILAITKVIMEARAQTNGFMSTPASAIVDTSHDILRLVRMQHPCALLSAYLTSSAFFSSGQGSVHRTSKTLPQPVDSAIVSSAAGSFIPLLYSGQRSLANLASSAAPRARLCCASDHAMEAQNYLLGGGVSNTSLAASVGDASGVSSLVDRLLLRSQSIESQSVQLRYIPPSGSLLRIFLKKGSLTTIPSTAVDLWDTRGCIIHFVGNNTLVNVEGEVWQRQRRNASRLQPEEDYYLLVEARLLLLLNPPHIIACLSGADSRQWFLLRILLDPSSSGSWTRSVGGGLWEGMFSPVIGDLVPPGTGRNTGDCAQDRPTFVSTDWRHPWDQTLRTLPKSRMTKQGNFTQRTPQAKKQSDQASRQVSKQASGSTNTPCDLVFPATGPSLGTTQPTATITSTEDLQRAAFTTPPQTAPGANTTEPPPPPIRNKGPELGADNLTLEGVATELAPSDFVSQNYETLVALMQEETKKRSSQSLQARLNFGPEDEVSPPRHQKERRRKDNRRPPVFGRIGKQVSGTQTANLQNLDTHEDNDRRISVRDRLGSRDVHSRLGQRRSPSESPPSSDSEDSRRKRRRRVSSSSEDTSDNEGAETGHWKSKNKYRGDEDEDMSRPWRRQKVDAFTRRISDFSEDKKRRMPANVKTYDGTGDPDDHLKIFESAATIENWPQPVWCHMFNSTLVGNARNWFSKLPRRSIDGFEELRRAFRLNFTQRKKCAKNPVELARVKQRQGESTGAYVERYKDECIHVKACPEILKISGFMNGINNPELIKRLNDRVPQTFDELMKRTRSFIQGEAAAADSRKGYSNNRSQEQSRRQSNDQSSSRNNSYRGQRGGRGNDKYTPLTMTPKEILATEGSNFPKPPPMRTPEEQRVGNGYCEYHRQKGHTTNECVQLRQLIDKLVKEGRLDHLVRNIKEGKDKQRSGGKKDAPRDKADTIYMVQSWQRKTKQKVSQKFSHGSSISFPTLTADNAVVEPLTIEINAAGHDIHRMYIDGGASADILYEHCFQKLRPEVKSQLNPATTSLTGFTGEKIWPMGQLRLPVMVGNKEHSTTAWMNFMVIRSPSPYNGIIGRPGISAIRAGGCVRTLAKKPRYLCMGTKPFPVAAGGLKFLIVAIDYFTKWIEVKAVAIITGNQTNGLVERANRSLGEGIKARLDRHKGRWVEELSHVLWAHRTTIKVSTGDTPFSLVYGTEAVIPAEIGMPTIRTAEVNIATNDDERRIDLDILEERREQAAIREEKAKLKMKGYYDAKVRGVSFRPGDFVYRANDASHAEDTGKLGPKWEGPYEVTEALGKGAYKLRDMDGRELPRTWNICNLKKCYL
ncbi:reverse transcriptase domain-containing protein [Tanacetum coccineum]|uniref:Reverse transcriptase domain-containing protein n=1 Tax=Tanacetum coccineum TaxID=301880 RepID=A0ABQ5FNU5_9ASTR